MLTRLETAVLEMMLDKNGEPYETLRQQLSYATVANREYTGVGFFTSFALSPRAPVRSELKHMIIDDVGAELPQLTHGAGFILFIHDGAIKTLEGYTYVDDIWPENTDNFGLFRIPASKRNQ